MGQESEITKSKGVFRWPFWLVGIVMIVVLILSVIVAPDQIGPLDEPDHYYAALIDSEMMSDSIASALNPPDSADESSIDMDQAVDEIANNLVDLPFETPDLSDAQLDAYQRFQEEMSEFYTECLTFPVETKSLSFEEGADRLEELICKRDAIVESYEKRPFTDSVWEYHAARWREVYDAMLLGFLVEQEHWRGAAGICFLRGDWNQEVYYWRKGGFQGRVNLAVRTVQRLLAGKKTKDATTDSN